MKLKGEAKALIAGVEGDTELTIVPGIRRSAEHKELHLPTVSDYDAVKGCGIRERLNGSDVFVGGPRLLESLVLQLPETLAEFEQAASDRGQSVVHLVQIGPVAAASFALADVIRLERREAV